MNYKEQQELITIPLKDLLWLILKDPDGVLSCAPVPEQTASILEHKLSKSDVYKLDHHDPSGKELQYYMLWWMKDWKTSTTNYAKQKAYSEKLRVEHWLMTANVSMVAKAIIKRTPIPEKDAMSMAYSMVKNPNAGIVLKAFFGVEKLKDKEEEL